MDLADRAAQNLLAILRAPSGTVNVLVWRSGSAAPYLRVLIDPNYLRSIVTPNTHMGYPVKRESRPPTVALL